MALDDPVRVIGCSELPLDWNWIAPLYRGPPHVDWRFFSARHKPWMTQVKGVDIGRTLAGLAARRALVRDGADLLLSFDPYVTNYVEPLCRRARGDTPHIALAFNFTDLPTGYRLRAMCKSFATIERFAVCSQIERAQYAERFDIPIERLEFLRWAVAAPISEPLPRERLGRYVVALGSEARDYATLCEAARKLPALDFVLIARAHSLIGVSVPGNVTVHLNLPWDRAWSLVWYADASLVPLRSADTPNGHVTVVGGMHLGKAQVVTASAGVSDYVTDGESALLVPPGDAGAFANAIQRLVDDPALTARLGTNARAFAQEHCSEATTVDFFRRQLRELLGR